MTRPRLLFVSARYLLPMDEGGKIRTGNILREMKGGAFDITLAAPLPPGPTEGIEALCDRFVGWPSPGGGMLRKLMLLGSALPVPVALDRSEAAERVLAAELDRRPALVVVDFPHAAVSMPRDVGAPSVMFTHNIEAEIFDRHAQVARFPRSLVWRDQARKMRRFEDEVLHRFTRVVAVSARDAAGLARDYRLSNIDTIDTGVDLEFYPFTPPPDDELIVFSGVMSSPANVDGIAFMAEAIWPILARARPGLRALIVGRNPTPAMLALSRTLPWQFTGSVPDIRPHVQKGAVSVIPLRVGSGTRLKAFEAMALGRPVVATSLGVEGLGITPGTHFLVGDTAEDFAAAVLRLLDDRALRQRIAADARAHLEEHYGWKVIARQFEAICGKALGQEAA